MITPRLLVISVIAIILTLSISDAHANGFGPLPSSYPQNKTMALSFSYMPGDQSGSLSEGSINLKLFDTKSDTPIKHVSFFVNVEKGNYQLMNNLFYTYSGNLTLSLQRGYDYNWVVSPDHDPIFVGGFESSDDVIKVLAQSLSKDESYHLQIEPVTFDESKMILANRTGIIFNADFNATSPSEQTISFDGKTTQENVDFTKDMTSAPEFPFAIPVLLVGIASLIVFTRMRFGK